MIGRKTTTTGVLFTNADKKATIKSKTARIRTGLFVPAIFSKRPASSSIKPVRSKTALIINIAATVIGAELPKTDMAFDGLNIPAKTRMIKALIAVRSGEIHSFRNEMKTRTMITQVSIGCQYVAKNVMNASILVERSNQPY